MVLSGPPGTGKTMLALRMASILPALSRREAVEVARIHGLAAGPSGALPSSRPFRAPHDSITTAGLVGGARRSWVGEVVLAHRGVLFLAKLSCALAGDQALTPLPGPSRGVCGYSLELDLLGG